MAAFSVACTALAGERDPDATRPPVRLDSSTPSAPDSNAQDIDSPETQTGLDFGEVGCGVDSAPKSITIVNKTNAPRPYQMVLEDGSVFQPLDPKAMSGTVPVGDPLVIKMIAAPKLSGGAKSNVVVASGSSFVQIALSVSGAGAALEWETATADIGEAPLDNDVTTVVKLKNTGTRAASITGFTGTTSDFVASAPSSIAPGQDADVTFKLVAGAMQSSVLTTTMTPQAGGLCAVAPSIAVSGQRVDTTVTVAGADWGKQPCTTTPTSTQDVVVKNYWTHPITWTIATPSIFTLGSGVTSGTVAAKDGTGPGVANITFKAPPLGAVPKPITEAIKLTVHGSGATLPPPADGDHVVNLTVDVRGAVLAITPSTLDFNATTKSSDQQSFKITNTGNEVAWLYWRYQRTAGGPAWTGLPQETGTNPGGGSTTWRIGYQPSTAPPNTATLSPQDDSSYMGGGRICNPSVLGAITLQGHELGR
ncbi:MAG TPA: choice-of-anchor D domain-containing protein [Labilithrix sp.]